jgi:phage tail sheath protein FI
MPTYRTPGVYVEEISTMPPSVAEVETAIPAFIGFTETGDKNVPKRITSLLDYQLYFGGAETETNINVAVSDDGEIEIKMPETSKNVMYYAMQLYFANGGGPCYIVSTGGFGDNGASNKDTYEPALAAIRKEDEPTLLVFPDAPFSLSPDQYYSLMNDAIQQATELGDRFAIVDVLVADPVDTRKSIDAFRGAIAGSESVNLKYGASYFPYLNTTINYAYDDSQIQKEATEVAGGAGQRARDLRARATELQTQAQQAEAASAAAPDDQGLRRTATTSRRAATQADTAATQAERDVAQAAGMDTRTLNSLALNNVKLKLNQLGVVLTPCAAIAGVYASVDNARGVWKAPANVSLNYVTSTTVKITDDDQDNMNVDVVDGKSVNAIRPFIGKGVKVWGARTLDGNDNEWRYINVRRFFNMVEESVKKSTYWAVFESNDSNTWVKVRAMIENYLLLKWRDGALAGAKPEDAFFVRVGLGQTMTAQDILEGRMIVEIGMAAVRPAEFIILKFSHKLQTS